MASTRTINAPGIELRELDRSNTRQQDNSLPNAPTVLITGVASKGENYYPQWINNRNAFIEKYGQPTTEFEKCFYYGCMEIIDRGGICIACKLPYDNAESNCDGEGSQEFSYCQYEISGKKTIGDGIGFSVDMMTIKKIQQQLIAILEYLKLYDAYSVKHKLNTVGGIRDAIDELYNEKIVEERISTTVRSAKQKLITILQKFSTQALIEIRTLDEAIQTYLEITSGKTNGKMSIEDLDDLRVGYRSSIYNKITIVDISRQQYTKTQFNSVTSTYDINGSLSSIPTNDALGIFPVIVTPTNAMFFQKLFNSTGIEWERNINLYNPISKLSTIELYSPYRFNDSVQVDLSGLYEYDNYIMPLNSLCAVADETVSKVTSEQFPLINYRDQYHLETKYLKQIGIVVMKAFSDEANNGKVNYQILESYVGSLDKNARSEYDNSSIFIDNIVNANSKYINVFSNVDANLVKQVDILHMNNQTSRMLGFHEIECKKNIDVTNTIIDPLTKVLEICKDPNTIPLDLVVDAGVSNIAQYFTSLESSLDKDNFVWTLYLTSDLKTQMAKWQQVIKKFDDFCHYTRRDCMFIADGLRPFCLIGNQKIVRPSKIGSSVEKDIVPFIRCIAGINSSYSAGYCDWFQQADDINGDLFWCPPSIKAASIYIYCDTYFHSWDAPAGMTRGIVPNVVDVAFTPNKDEAGKIYSQSWNYAISYPMDGIIMEGQKTFQTTKSALDRVNVRRLLLKLEKQVVRAAKHFLYEGNTEYTRQRFVDTIRPYFEAAVSGNGILEYAIKCDNEINTAETIDNNELHCKIAIKPVKTIEYIVISFITTSQSASVTEEVAK